MQQLHCSDNAWSANEAAYQHERVLSVFVSVTQSSHMRFLLDMRTTRHRIMLVICVLVWQLQAC